MSQMPDIRSILKEGIAFLKSKKLPDFKSDAEYLLSSVIKIKRSNLPLAGDKKISKKEKELFENYLARRAKREPAAYITGDCGFMGLDFMVDESVLIPRPETELLVEEVLKVSEKQKYDTAVDVCTGSGCIAVSLAKLGNFKKIYACDISSAALNTAKKNAALNSVNNTEFILSDMFESLYGIKTDIMVSNPPYVSYDEYDALEPELKFEPKSALLASDGGLFFYKIIASKAHEILNKGGYLFLELNSNIAGEIKSLFEEKSFKDIELIKDYSGLDRILKAHL